MARSLGRGDAREASSSPAWLAPSEWLPALPILALFAFGVHHYWFIGDDAYISFRYAANWVTGHGLVFNAGEYVEGYTNFLWVALMALAILLQLPVEWTANLLGTAAGIGVLALVWWLAREASPSSRLVWLAPAALAGNRSFTAWSTGGLESQLFVLLTLSAIARYLFERGQRPLRPFASALLLAMATLTRPDGAVFVAVVASAFVADAFLRRRRPQDLALWLGVVGGIIAAHLAWRHSYYGYWFPNTFYAKVSGAWLTQGGEYLGFFARDHALWLLGPLALAAVIRLRRVSDFLLLAVVASWCSYLLWIGGDRFEYRFATPMLPALCLLSQRGVEAVSGALRPGALRVLLCAVLATGVLYAMWRPNFSAFRPTAGIMNVEAIARYARGRAYQGRVLRSFYKAGYLDGSEILAVTGAGALPYYSGLPAIDVHGLNDVRIAHQPLSQRGTIGHEKYATPEYLIERGVVIYDIFNHIVLPPSASGASAEANDKGWELERPDHGPPSYEGLRRVELRAKGHVLQFGTALDEAELRERFQRFEIRLGGLGGLDRIDRADSSL